MILVVLVSFYRPTCFASDILLHVILLSQAARESHDKQVASLQGRLEEQSRITAAATAAAAAQLKSEAEAAAQQLKMALEQLRNQHETVVEQLREQHAEQVSALNAAAGAAARTAAERDKAAQRQAEGLQKTVLGLQEERVRDRLDDLTSLLEMRHA
jgi:GTPase involved in cell partitioning and DNA repair